MGRIKDVINRAGEKISPEEVERHLWVHPAVRDAAVRGVPDAVLGERTCAFLVLRDDVTSTVAKAHLRERGVASYKIPDRIVTLTELPRAPTGKVDRNALRDDLRKQ